MDLPVKIQYPEFTLNQAKRELTDLEPELFWKYFREVSSIPRETSHEEKIIAYLENLAQSRGIESRKDEAGNIVFRIPASPGCENAPILILQSHVDMVCVKDADSMHDFRTDPIRIIVGDEWVTADGTSLGADNGVGVAASLALLDEPDLIHPRLEILFTVGEEQGLVGAYQLGDDMLRGKIMINLDAGEVDKPCLGSGGGIDSIITMKTPRTKQYVGKSFILKVDGVSGGHSGDLYKKKAHAIKIMASVLFRCLDRGIGIAFIRGGSRRNAIPVLAEAGLVIPDDEIDDVRKICEEEKSNALEIHSVFDPKINIQIHETGNFKTVIKRKYSDKLVRMLMALPNGLMGINAYIEELPQNSTNLAIVDTTEKNTLIYMFSRGNIESGKHEVKGQIEAVAAMAGCVIAHESDYSGWKVNPDSELYKRYGKFHDELLGRPHKLCATHGGLESAIIASKFGMIDVISMAPFGENPHSTGERLKIKEVPEYYSLLKLMVTSVGTDVMP
jgi:dipeptidase D